MQVFVILDNRSLFDRTVNDYMKQGYRLIPESIRIVGSAWGTSRNLDYIFCAVLEKNS